MENVTQARRKFKVKLSGKQDTSKPIPALLGNGFGVVVVPNQAGMVYYRAGNEESPGMAFNNRVPLSNDLAVDVGYDPITDPDRHLFQVLSIRQTAYVDAGSQPIPQVGPHGSTHEFGGGDDVFIEWRRLMGLRVGRPVLFVLTVDWGYIYRGGTWIQAPVGATTVDLTATHAALVGTQAQMVLISLNSAGALATTNGTVVANPAILTIANCPVPPSGNIPLAAVRLYATQTAIGDTPSAPDIIDLRFPTYATMSGGWDLVGNAGTTPATNYAGTSDNQDFVLRANAIERMRLVPANSAVLFGESSHGIAALADNSVINIGDGHSASVSVIVYGANNPSFQNFRALGTLAAPTRVTTDTYLFTVGGRGYYDDLAGHFGWEGGARGSFNVLAAENHTDVAHGTYATIRTTQVGAVATQEVVRFDDLGETLPNLTASTVIYSDANKRIQSLANANGVLTNTAGVLSWSTTIATAWNLTGNAGTDPTTQFLGTTDDKNIVFKRNNVERMRFDSYGVHIESSTDYGIYLSNTSVDTNTTGIIAATTGNVNTGVVVASNAVTRGSGAVTINSATAYLAGACATSGGCTITTAYGLYIDSQKAAGVTTGYGVYQYSGDDINYFAGNITTATTKWIGMGAAKGRITFTDAATDTMVFSDCNIGINQAPIHRLDVNAAVVAGNTIVTGIYHLQPSSGGAILEIGYGSAYPTVNSMIISYQNAGAANGSALALLTHKNSATSDDYNIILYGNSSGKVGIGTNAPTISDGAGLHVAGKIIRIATAKTPSSSGDTGNVGEICWDASYIYVCTAANTWERAAIAAW